MLGGLRVVIGFIVLLIIFALVFIIMVCSYHSGNKFCIPFDPLVSFMQSIIGTSPA